MQCLEYDVHKRSGGMSAKAELLVETHHDKFVVREFAFNSLYGQSNALLLSLTTKLSTNRTQD